MPGSGPWRASWSSAPGSAGSPLPPGSRRSATRSRSASRPTTVGGKARRVHPRRVHLRHRPVPADAARGLPRPVHQDRASRSRTSLDLVAGRPDLPLPVRRRHRARRCRTHRAPAPAGRSTTRSVRAPAPTGTACSTAPRRSGRPPATPFLESAARRDGATCCAWPAAPATCARSRRGGRCAASARTTCATRGSAWCSTATRPTPAPTRAAPRRRWQSSPTSSRRSAPGTSAAGCTGWPLAVHDRAVERGAVVRTGADVAEVIVESGRAAGVRLVDGRA